LDLITQLLDMVGSNSEAMQVEDDLLSDNFYLFSKQDYDSSIATQPPRSPVSQLPELDLLSELLSPAPTAKVPVELWSEKSNYKLSFSSNRSSIPSESNQLILQYHRGRRSVLLRTRAEGRR
jgi:hypothetical protein